MKIISLFIVFAICILFVFKGATELYSALFASEYLKNGNTRQFKAKRKYKRKHGSETRYFIEIVDNEGHYKTKLQVDEHEWNYTEARGEFYAYKDVYVPSYKLASQDTSKKGSIFLKPYVVVSEGINVCDTLWRYKDKAFGYFGIAIAEVVIGLFIVGFIR